MPVCIAGMHRSGTSMVANLLGGCGLYLGAARDLMEPAPQNPEGFWENIRFVRVNEEVLNALGGGWDCPPPPPADWADPRLDAARVKAGLVLDDFRDREPWGWKDPRNSLTVPFWTSLIGPTKVIVVVRNPLEVALSLRVRNGFSYALGLNLWTTHYQRLLDGTDPADLLVTHYEAYFADCAAELRRLLAFVGLDAPAETVEDACAVAVGALRHHRFTTQHLIEAEVAPEVLDLYRRLCAAAGWGEDGLVREPAAAAPRRRGGRTRAKPRNGQPPAVGGEGEAAMRDPNRATAGVGRLNESIVELEVQRRELVGLRSEIDARDATIAELHGVVGELQEAVAQHEATRVLLTERADSAERIIGELQGAVEQHEATRVLLTERAEAAERAATERAETIERAARERAETIERVQETAAQAVTERDAAERALGAQRQSENEWRRTIAAQEQTLVEQAAHLDALAARLDRIPNREAELRAMLTDATDQLVRRDTQIVAALGLARQRDGIERATVHHAPALVERIRHWVGEVLPPAAQVLVLSHGDEALLLLEGRRGWHFPRAENGGWADVPPTDGATLVSHLRALREQGATYLLVPTTAVGWLMASPEFKQHVEQHYRFLVRDFATCLIFASNADAGG